MLRHHTELVLSNCQLYSREKHFGRSKALDLFTDNVDTTVIRGIELENVLLVLRAVYAARKCEDGRGLAGS